MSLNLDTSQLSELESYQPPHSPMRKKQQILEQSKKGHERCVDRLQRKIICDKIANEEAKKQELQEKARKLKEWNNLMETVKSYQIPLIASISTSADDDTPFPLSPTKKVLANDSLLSTLEKEAYQNARDDKKAELAKLANLEAKERCTTRKRWYEGKTSFETFNKLLKFQNERRNAYNEGRFKIMTLDEEFDEFEDNLAKSQQQVGLNQSNIAEKTSTGTVVEDIQPQKQPLTPLEISSGSIGNVRGVITPKVSLVKKSLDFVVQYLDKEELVSTQEIRKMVSLICRNVIENQEDLHRKRVRVYISKEMDQIVKRVIFACNTRQAIQGFVLNICDAVIRNQNEIERKKRNTKFISQEVNQILKRIIHYNETRQEIEGVVSLTLKNIIATQIDKQNREYVSRQVQSILDRVIHHQTTKQQIEKTAFEICQNVLHTQETRQYIERVVSNVFENVVNHQNTLCIKNEVDQIFSNVIHTQETKQNIEKTVEEILMKVVVTQGTILEEKKIRLFIEKEVTQILKTVVQTQTINSLVSNIIYNVIRTQEDKQDIEIVTRDIIFNVINHQNTKLQQERNQAEISKVVESIVSNVIQFQETKKSIETYVSQIIENVIYSQSNKLEVQKVVCDIIQNVISHQVKKKDCLLISAEVNSIIQRVIDFQLFKKEENVDSPLNSEKTSEGEAEVETRVIIEQEVERIFKNVISNWEYHNKIAKDESNKLIIQKEVEEIVKIVISKWQTESMEIKQKTIETEEIQQESQVIIKQFVEEALGNVVNLQNSLFIKNEVESIILRVIGNWKDEILSNDQSIKTCTVEQVISQEVQKIIQNVISRNQ